jgi:hypothetical protein
MQINS